MKPRKQNQTMIISSVQRSFFLVILYLCVLLTVDAAYLATKAPLAKRTLCYQGISSIHHFCFSSHSRFPLLSFFVLFALFYPSFSSLPFSTRYTILTGSDTYQSSVKSCALLDSSYTGVWMCSKIQVCMLLLFWLMSLGLLSSSLSLYESLISLCSSFLCIFFAAEFILILIHPGM